MTTQWLIIFLLTVLVNAIDTSAYAARLAGVRTGHPALAGSLYNVLMLGSRGANALAGPLLASLTDVAVLNHNIGSLLNVYRVVVLAASVGTGVAALGMPSLSRILARGIAAYENRRSLPQVIVRGASVQGLWRMTTDLTPPRLSAVRESRRSPFPKRFLLASILVTAIAAVSNAAAMYASALVPAGARTATSLSPMLAGCGLVLSIFVVNPVAALVTDEALREQRPLKDVTYITIWQVGAQLIGTLVAQLLLWPAGQVIALVTRWLVA
ncbi:MAG TPA: DUF2837 family protein [Anaerolineae bacterium]|nr:DUF2837 family protein [Anaerolineae bacterium]HQH38004.1 DUF2837 family protein [Anaerolineae bacterium]